jgi:hypothetical protein
LRLSLNQGSNESDGRLHLTVDEQMTGPEQVWLVHWIPLITELAKIKEIKRYEVGSLSAQGNEIRYTWAEGVPNVAEAAIRNSVLRIQIGDSEHFVALRAPEQWSSLSFNLKRPKSTVILSVDDQPEIESIRIDVTDPSVFPMNEAEGGGFRGLKLDDIRTLRFRNAPGAAARLSVSKRGRRVAVNLEFGYKLPSGYEAIFTVARAASKMQALRAELAAAKALKTRVRNTSANNIDSAIAVLTADVRAFESIGKLAERLHESQVPLRAYIEVSDHRVVLAGDE